MLRLKWAGKDGESQRNDLSPIQSSRLQFASTIVFFIVLSAPDLWFVAHQVCAVQ